MAVRSYLGAKDKIYSDITIPQKEPTVVPTLGSIISDLLGDQKGDVVHSSKTGGANWQDDKVRMFSKESVAQRLGISVDMLNKKLYHRDTSREWIIAICAANGLDAKQTSEALIKYDHPSLDIESDRDEFIETFLDEHRYTPTSLAALNGLLIAKGMLPLQIQKRDSGARSRESQGHTSSFRQVGGIHLRTFGFDGDQYDSLETEFFPSHRVSVSMLVKSPADEYYELSASSDGLLVYHGLTETDDGKLDYKSANDVIGQKATVDHPDFGRFFLELVSKVKKEMQKYDDLLHDSRNYQGRFSANLKDDALHAFYEEYNYAFPERNEYYLMEYWKGQYFLSVAHKSMFMQEYLSEEEYNDHYHSREPIIRKTYSSISEIEERLVQTTDWHTELILRNRKRTFLKFQQLLAAKVADIRDRKIFIRNFDAIWENPADVLRYYEIEDLFECEYDSDYGEISHCLDEVTVNEGTEREMVVTFDDVRMGFECGFSSFEQICEYRRLHESVAEVLL